MTDRLGHAGTPRPPALFRALVRRLTRFLLDSNAREALLGDLEEDFRERLAVAPRAARARYRRDAIRSIASLLRHPVHHPLPPSRSGDSPMHLFLDDLRLASRSLRRAPGFSLVVIATLALGIGSITAVYTLVDGVILRPLPFTEPDRLVRLFGYDTDSGNGAWSSSYPDFEDFRDRTSSFAGLAAAAAFPSNLSGHREQPERLQVGYVSHDLFALLGSRTTIGRGFTPDDDRRGAEPVALISTSFWRRHFAGGEGDDSVIGRQVRLNDTPHTIVGVVDDPHYPPGAEVFAPLEPQPGTEVRGVHNLSVVGRLAADVTVSSATAEVGAIAQQLSETYPGENLTRGARLEPLHESMVGPLRQPFALVLGAAAFVLLIVCANVSNLLLHRAARRGREVATRAALGAGAPQLLRQFFAESIWLVSLGGTLGLVLAWLGKELQLRHIPTALPRLDEVALDGRVLLFGLAVTGVIAIGFALVPVFEVNRRHLFALLASGARNHGDSRGQQRVRKGLVVIEIALAVVLVVGSGLMIQTLRRLADVDPGFESEAMLVMPLELQTPFVSDAWPQTLTFFDQLSDRIEALPGVTGVSRAYQSPADAGWGSSFTIEGEPAPEEGREPEAAWRPVAENYFDTLGIPMLQGRAFRVTDHAENAGAVIVNRAFVDRYLPDEPRPVGRIIEKSSWWHPEIAQLRIVGVVADVKFSGLHRGAPPALYFPHRQFPVPQMKMLVRTAGEPLLVAEAVRRAVWSLDPDLPIGPITTMEESLAGTYAYQRFLTRLLTFFGATALFLSALGLYGVIAYATAQRTREIGVRVAIGAQRSDVFGLVLGQGVALTLTGLALGFAGTWGLTRALESALFGVRRSDPTTLALVAVSILAVALLATSIPARRALRIQPTQALQEE